MSPSNDNLDAAGRWTRRRWLQHSGLGLGALGLTHLLSRDGWLAADQGAATQHPLRARSPHFPGRAKRVIQFFLNGGPSHVDTFDPKPALTKYAGQPLPEAGLGAGDIASMVAGQSNQAQRSAVDLAGIRAANNASTVSSITSALQQGLGLYAGMTASKTPVTNTANASLWL